MLNNHAWIKSSEEFRNTLIHLERPKAADHLLQHFYGSLEEYEKVRNLIFDIYGQAWSDAPANLRKFFVITLLELEIRSGKLHGP